MSCECGHCVGMTTAWDALEKKLCPEGKAAAKRKFKVYPSDRLGFFLKPKKMHQIIVRLLVLKNVATARLGILQKLMTP